MKIVPVPHGLEDLIGKSGPRTPGLHMRLIQKFVKHHKVMPSGCWQWTWKLSSNGYAQIYSGTWAHRWSYLCIDHLCRNRGCVNPDHLEAVTQRENTLRGIGPVAINATKTHCVLGHEFTPDNTHHYKGKRQCRECGRRAWREWNARRKQ